MVTTGAIVTPQASSSTLLNVAGPAGNPASPAAGGTSTNGAITIGSSASAGAPAQTYYAVVTYTAAGPIESLLSNLLVINCPAGFLPTVSVAAAGAPASATNFAAYMGIFPSNLALQQATKITTALGATFTAANPLTNSIGINNCATNDNANIVGLALHDSTALQATGIGGSFTAGGIPNLLGAWVNPPPLGFPDPAQQLVISLSVNQPIEISIKQPWSDALIGTTAGLLLDATTGFFLLDNSQANKIFTITEKVYGNTSNTNLENLGQFGDINARVIAFVSTATALLG